jgi:hypothetical protein
MTMYQDETIERVPAAADAASAAPALAPSPDPAEAGWRGEVVDLLRRAADITGTHGGLLDAFVEAAYGIYLERNPAVRERLEEAQLMAQVEDLRRAGRVGNA